MAKTEKPTINQRAKDAICPNCGGEVVRRAARGKMPTFCTLECNSAFQARQRHEGRIAIAFLKAWRIDRGSGRIARGAFAELCAIADHFNAEDNKNGRPRADLYAAKLLADGAMFFDRSRT